MLDKKDNKVTSKRIRLTLEEASRIEKKAEEAGLTISEYIRKVALGNVVKKRRNLGEDKLLYQLAKIGANLNQLVKAVHLGIYINDQVNVALRELREVLRKLK